MDVRTHLRIIWHYRVPVVALAIGVAVTVFILTSGGQATYVDDALLQVVVDPEADNPQDRSGFLASSYVEMAETAPVLQSAIDIGGLALSVSDLRDVLDVTADVDTGFVRITARAESAEEATAVAGGAADALIGAVTARVQAQRDARLAPLDAQIAALRAELAALASESPDRDGLIAELGSVLGVRAGVTAQAPGGLELVEPPGGEVERESAGAFGLTVTALLVALILNAELAVALHSLTDRLLLDDPVEVEATLGLPVLALVDHRDDRSARDLFRDVRTSLLERGVRAPVRLAVVGAGGASIRADVSIGVAESFADLGTAVLLVDADLRSPSLHDRYGLDRTPGIGDLARPGTVLADSVRALTGERNMRLVAAGDPVEDPGGVVCLQLPGALDTLERSDVVVVNTPDAGTWNDAVALAATCDATVVVIVAGARRRATQALVARLRAAGGTPVGAIVLPGG